MDLGIKNKRALVTGGAVGIGQSIAMELAKEGAKVIVTSRRESDLKKTIEILGGSQAGHHYITCNITDEGAPESLIKEIHRDFGEIDIVVNNVGDTLKITDPYCPINDWRKIFRLNLEVAIEINNLLIPYMKSKDWGRIVNITAGAALENTGPVPYCASLHKIYGEGSGN